MINIVNVSVVLSVVFFLEAAWWCVWTFCDVFLLAPYTKGQWMGAVAIWLIRSFLNFSQQYINTTQHLPQRTTRHWVMTLNPRLLNVPAYQYHPGHYTSSYSTFLIINTTQGLYLALLNIPAYQYHPGHYKSTYSTLQVTSTPQVPDNTQASAPQVPDNTQTSAPQVPNNNQASTPQDTQRTRTPLFPRMGYHLIAWNGDYKWVNLCCDLVLKTWIQK